MSSAWTKTSTSITRPHRTPGCGRCGTTLVEVLVATLLLSLLAVAGGAYIERSCSEAANQKHRRVALDVAGSRMEALRAAGYSAIKPTGLDYAARYLAPSGSGWAQSLSNPGETTNLNGRLFRIVSTCRYLDVDGETPSYDHVALSVSVAYRDRSADTIVLESFDAPL